MMFNACPNLKRVEINKNASNGQLEKELFDNNIAY